MTGIAVAILAPLVVGLVLFFFQQAGLIRTGFLLRRHSEIGINYARFFGAYQVPFYLRAVEHQTAGPLRFLTDSESGQNAADFFEKWEFRDARFIKSEVYDSLWESAPSMTGHALGTKLLQTSCEGDNVAMDFFNTVIDRSRLTRSIFPYCYADPYIQYREQVPGDYPVQNVLDRVRENSDTIGFLLLFLENRSDNTLYDVRLKYSLTRQYSPITQKLSTRSKDTSIDASETRTKSIDYFRPGNSFLWLLGVYRKDEHGYPETYLSDTIRPIRLSYRKQSRILTFAIRAPLGDRAARVSLPFGWYHQ